MDIITVRDENAFCKKLFEMVHKNNVNAIVVNGEMARKICVVLMKNFVKMESIQELFHTNEYADEFVLYIWNNKLFAYKAKGVEGYRPIRADKVFIFEDCNSIILKNTVADTLYEVDITKNHESDTKRLLLEFCEIMDSYNDFLTKIF